MKTETEKELRELDIFCAEKVMGWRIFRSGRGSTVAMADGGTDREREYIIATSHPWESPEWNPTTNPADAMAVLEKCGQKEIRGTSFVCIAFSDGNNSTLSKSGHWNVGRLDRDGKWVSGEIANALTLLIAICKFAKQLFSK